MFAQMAVAQTDVTSTYIQNADFSSSEGWTEYKAEQYVNLGMGKIGELTINNVASTTDDTHTADQYCAGISARWSSNYAAYQQTSTVTLPAGLYTLSYDVENPGGSSEYEMENLFYVTVGATTVYDEAITAANLAQASAKAWTAHSIEFEVTEANAITVSLGYKNVTNAGSGTTPELFVSNLKLVGYTYAEKCAELLATAKAIDQSTLNAGVKGVLTNAITAGESASTEDAYKTAIADLQSAISVANSCATAVAAANEKIAACEAVLNNSTSDDNTFATTISDAKTALDAATTIEAINAAVESLETARQTYVQTAVPNDGYSFDYTFAIEGAGDSKDGWTSSITSGSIQNFVYKNSSEKNTDSFAKTGFIEAWNGSAYTAKISYTKTGLRTGHYKISAYTFVTVDGTASFFANDKTVALDNTTNLYTQPVIEDVTVTDGTLTFGLDVESSNWVGITNIQLYYLSEAGNDEVLTAAKEAYNDALEKAKAAAENTDYANVTGSEKTALETVISNYGSVSSSTASDYTTATEALTTATTSFTEAKTNYDAYAAEKAYADRIDASIATAVTAPTTAAEAATAVETLKTTEFTKVNEIYNSNVTDTYNIGTFADWTFSSTVGSSYSTQNSQHWSGNNQTYYEQSGSSWGASAFTDSYTKTVTLPAGKYLLKLAGRSSTGATLSGYATVDGTDQEAVSIPSKGDAGYGIDTEGNTNFSADGTYANNGAGRGWEWRYIPVTLDAEASVTFTFKGEASTTHQWFSLSDLSLWKLSTLDGELADTKAALEALKESTMSTTAKDSVDTALSNAEQANTDEEKQASIDEMKAAIETANNSIAAYKVLADAFTTYEDKAKNLDEAGQSAYATAIETIKSSYNSGSYTNEEAQAKVSDVEAAYRAAVAAQTTEGTNMTDVIINPEFIYGSGNTFTGWTVTDGIEEQNNGELTGRYAECWSWNASNGLQSVKQTVTLHKGVYRLSAMIVARRLAADLYAKIGDETTKTTVDGLVKENQSVYFIVTDETAEVEIGYETTGQIDGYTSGDGWFASDNYTLTYISAEMKTFTLNETDEALPITTETCGNVILNRSLSASKWNTFCVPFEMPIPEGMAVEKFTGATIDNGNTTLSFENVTDRIEAGVAYLVKPSTDMTEMTIESTVIKIADPTKTTYNGVSMVGNYVKTTVPENAYFINNDKFYLADNANVELKGFRAYLTVDGNAGAKTISISIDGETTAINSINGADSYKTGDIYSLSGVKMGNSLKDLKRGVYIMNGKKVVIK